MSAMPARTWSPPPQTRRRVVPTPRGGRVTRALAGSDSRSRLLEAQACQCPQSKCHRFRKNVRRHPCQGSPGQCLPGPVRGRAGRRTERRQGEGGRATGPSTRHLQTPGMAGVSPEPPADMALGVSGSRPSRDTAACFSRRVSVDCAEGRGLPKAGVWLQWREHRARVEGDQPCAPAPSHDLCG